MTMPHLDKRTRDMKKTACLCWVLAFVFLGCGKAGIDLEIPRSTVQEMVARKFPFEKNAIIARFKVHTPNVYFEGTQIGLKLKYDSNFLNKELSGSVDVRGDLSFDSQKAQFLLKNAKIVKMEVSDPYFQNKEKLKSAINSIVSNYLDGYPVYTLNQSNIKEYIKGKLIKKIVVKNDSLIVTFGV